MTVLSDRKWSSLLTDHLVSDGWSACQLIPRGAKKLYFQPVEDLVLLTSVETSRHDASRFTSSFYLGPTFCWSLGGGDTPREAYARIGHFIDTERYSAYALPAAESPLQRDAWWVGFTAQHIDGLARAIHDCCPIFMSQPALATRVRESKTFQQHRDDVNRVIDHVVEGRGVPLPPRLRTNKAVHEGWYRAAALTLANSPVAVHADGVKFLAEDAWSTFQARGRSGI